MSLLRFGDDTPAKWWIGDDEVAMAWYGDDQIWPIGTAPTTASHTYTVRSGAGSSLTGYWLNNIGSIEDATYNLPDGTEVTIRQTMFGGTIGANQLRFLVDKDNITAADDDQFPPSIRLTLGANVAVVVKQDPVEIREFGQGIGMDYAVESGTLSDVLVNNQTTTVVLEYGPPPPPPDPTIAAVVASMFGTAAGTTARVVTTVANPADTVVYSRHRIGAGRWTNLRPQTATAAAADITYNLVGLTTDSEYTFESSLNADYSGATSITFTPIVQAATNIEFTFAAPRPITSGANMGYALFTSIGWPRAAEDRTFTPPGGSTERTISYLYSDGSSDSRLDIQITSAGLRTAPVAEYPDEIVFSTSAGSITFLPATGEGGEPGSGKSLFSGGRVPFQAFYRIEGITVAGNAQQVAQTIALYRGLGLVADHPTWTVTFVYNN